MIVVITGISLISTAGIDKSEALDIELAASKRHETILGVVALSLGIFFLASQIILEEFILKN